MGNTNQSHRIPTSPAVHPHVHGEHNEDTIEANPALGSSPRTWGTLQELDIGVGAARFIPTYMGNTRPMISNIATAPVHPHVHGEHERRTPGKQARFGSSPRTWGTLLSSMLQQRATRFIPTYMGNTDLGNTTYPSFSVHPHVHGEHGGWGVTTQP